MKIKVISTLFLLIVSTFLFGQFERYNSFEQLDSISKIYIQNNDLDSAIIAIEIALDKFPEYDEKATFILDFLFLKTNQDSKSLENWDHGLKKRYFFGLSLNWNSKRFKNNPEFDRLAKIDKQIGDSLSNLSHVEYEVVLPINYSKDEKYPLLFVFHGNNRNLQQAKYNWTSSIVKDKFIAVYMQSYIYMSQYTYQWKMNDKKTNNECKEIYKQIIKNHPVNTNKVIFLAMSAGGMIAIDYTFNQFVPVSGLVLNCPVVPDVSDNSIRKFVDENKKIGIITGEKDFALNNQKDLINKVDEIGGNNRITINTGIGHEFAKDFSTILDDYLNWIIE
jgi:tetratricopeptide (TPR) repeat protein